MTASYIPTETDSIGAKFEQLRQELAAAEKKLAAVAAEAESIRAAYLEFWGAHSSNDLTALGRRPKMPPTPELDALDDGKAGQ